MVTLGMDPETAGPLAYSRVSPAKPPRDGEPITLSKSAAYCRVFVERPTSTHHGPRRSNVEDDLEKEALGFPVSDERRLRHT